VAEDGFLNGKRYVLMDRDAKFCEAFRDGLQSGDVDSIRLPPRSPNCNAHLERFMRSLRGRLNSSPLPGTPGRGVGGEGVFAAENTPPSPQPSPRITGEREFLDGLLRRSVSTA
jgi:hypothetical protein